MTRFRVHLVGNDGSETSRLFDAETPEEASYLAYEQDAAITVQRVTEEPPEDEEPDAETLDLEELIAACVWRVVGVPLLWAVGVGFAVLLVVVLLATGAV